MGGRWVKDPKTRIDPDFWKPAAALLSKSKDVPLPGQSKGLAALSAAGVGWMY